MSDEPKQAELEAVKEAPKEKPEKADKGLIKHSKPMEATKPMPKPQELTALETVMSLLEKLTVPELASVINSAEEKRRERRDEGLAALREKMRQEAEILGVAMTDLFPQFRQPINEPLQMPRRRGPARQQPERASQAGSLPPKFRGPNGEEWSGRGRTPNWFAKLKEAGENMQQYVISRQQQ